MWQAALIPSSHEEDAAPAKILYKLKQWKLKLLSSVYNFSRNLLADPEIGFFGSILNLIVLRDTEQSLPYI